MLDASVAKALISAAKTPFSVSQLPSVSCQV